MTATSSQRRYFVRASATTTNNLPDDLKRRGVRRIEIFAWLVLAVDAFGTLVDHIGAAATESDWPNQFHVFDLIGSGGIGVLSGIMIVCARSRLSLDRRILVGVLYFLVLAFAIAVTDFGDGFWLHDGGNNHLLHGVPSHMTVMLVTPVIVPMTAWRAFAATTAMAACGPIAMLLDAQLLGLPWPAPQPMVQSFPFLMIPVATALGHIVHRLGLDVKRARDLGSYTLEHKLGEGGMGEVWRARHRFLARPAAVKLIRGEGATSTQRARFEREAQATALLKSPHTVEVFEYGVSKAGEIYYVMELLDGFDLEQLVQEDGAQPPLRVVSWIRQACHSLQEAHDAGIVHRDIKPANLFLCRYGQDIEFLKVVDFGLATLAPTLDAGAPTLTGDNTIVGTPAYLPPELATGKTADARSDLYALGCVAYFALTGKRPFEGKSAIEVIVGHLEKPPIALSAILGDELPPDLESLVLDCMAKSPVDRPASAKEVIRRLAHLPAWPDEDAQRWWTDRLAAPAAASDGPATTKDPPK